MSLRPFFGFLHRWVGLAIAGFLFISGVTGAVISWDHELDDLLNPHLMQSRAEGPALPPLELARRVEARDPRVHVTFVPLLRVHGQFPLREMWERAARTPGFFETMPEMPDAMELFEAVRHLNPIILTGLPMGNWAADQKVRWAAQHFPGTRIITTLAKDKRDHGKPGDVLVDDQLRHAALWEGMGGVFIHHKSVGKTLERLGEYFEL